MQFRTREHQSQCWFNMHILQLLDLRGDDLLAGFGIFSNFLTLLCISLSYNFAVEAGGTVTLD